MKIKNPLNEVLFKRKRKIYIKKGNGNLKDKKVEVFNAVLAKYGFTLSKNLMDIFKTLSKKEFEYESTSLIRYIQNYTKSNKNFIPLFLNFPTETQIEEGVYAKLEFFFQEIIGAKFYSKGNYRTLSCGHTINEDIVDLSKFGACPVCEQQIDELSIIKDKKIKTYKETTPLEIIDIADKNEIYEVLRNLLNSNVALGEGDYNDIRKIISNEKTKKIANSIPNNIKVKETLAMFMIILMEEDKEELLSIIDNKLTVTDVLRIAAALSNEDVSLHKSPYFKNFKNKERKFLLKLLESTNLSEEDFKKYKEEWKRICEKIHPGDFKNKFPQAVNALKNIKFAKSFKTKYEELLRKGEFAKAAIYISKRPGEFIRTIEFFIRKGVNVNELLKNNITKVKTKDLIFLEKHLEAMAKGRIIPLNYMAKLKQEKKEVITKEEKKIEEIFNQIRIEGVTVNTPKESKAKEIKQYYKDIERKMASNKFIFGRYFMPKGEAKYFVKKDPVKILNPEKVQEVNSIIKKELNNRLKENEDRKVWIDPELKTILIPKNLRDYSEGLKFYARGSRIKYKPRKVTRFFLYWKGNADLDLSVIILDKDMNVIERCAYTDLKSKHMIHSGDIRKAPKGAAEFIDISSMNKIKKAKYIIPFVISFTGESFKDLDSFVGVMSREKPKSGELFEPRSVEYRFDLKGNQSQVPLVYDIENEEMIITDLYKKGRGYENSYSISEELIERFSVVNDLVLSNPNMFDLFKRKYKNVVEDKEEAELIIGRDSGDIKATEIERIVSDIIE